MEKMDRIKTAIQTVLSEHLDCFALVGFDTEGNEITIQKANTDMHTRAVNDAYREWYDTSFGGEQIEAECEWADDDEE